MRARVCYHEAVRYGMKVAGLCLLCACAYGVQEDTPVVESPTPLPPVDEPGTRLEDQPAVEDLPDWLIDIPPEQPGDAAPSARPIQQYVKADEHVVSSSRMFSVSGGDALRMGAIATHAEELRSRLYKLLGIGSKWKYPVSIRLLGNTADAATPNPIRTRVRLMGSSPDLQIRIFAGGGISIDKLDAALVTILLYEYAMRGIQPEALPDYLEMPPWLIAGIRQAILWKQGRADRRLYRNLFSSSEMMSPESIMDTAEPDKLDAGSRQLYEVSCGVLIMGLLREKHGADQLRNLLAESLTQEGRLQEVLGTHFHSLETDGNSLSKWWALELAALSEPNVMETLTPIETEKLLSEALLVTAMDKETRVPYFVSVADVEELVKVPGWREMMRGCTDRLSELSLRCFPGYRSIVMEYVRAIGELLNGSKLEDVAAILTPLRELREAYKEASIRGRDYLDWFEITRLGNTQRENFDHYIESMRMLRRETPGPSTPISRYLDDIEALHSLKEGEALPERLRKAAHPPTAKP